METTHQLLISVMIRVVQKAYIAGPHTTYILVYSVYTSISVHERILGAPIATHAQYTTYILVFPYIVVFPHAKRICL